MMIFNRFWALAVCFVVVTFTLSACYHPETSTLSAATTKHKPEAIEKALSDYPQPGNTYLSFDSDHGFQVNYLGPKGRAWLWYPGNSSGVPEDYKVKTKGGDKMMCFRHPSNSYNPATRQYGGEFVCMSLNYLKIFKVSVLPGDPFNLASGKIPYRLNRCKAPDDFEFDRSRIRC